MNISKMLPDLKVAILSSAAEDNYVTEAVKLGVNGYLLKEMEIYSCIDAIKNHWVKI